MTPSKIAVDIQDVVQDLVEHVAALCLMAQRIQTTEHVQQGTEEWDQRERAKELFDQGEQLLFDLVADMHTW